MENKTRREKATEIAKNIEYIMSVSGDYDLQEDEDYENYPMFMKIGHKTKDKNAVIECLTNLLNEPPQYKPSEIDELTRLYCYIRYNEKQILQEYEREKNENVLTEKTTKLINLIEDCAIGIKQLCYNQS